MAKAKRLKEYEAWSRSLQGQEIPNLVAGAKFLGGPVGNLDLPIADDKPTFRYLTSIDLPSSVFYFDNGFVYNNDKEGEEYLKIGSHGTRFLTLAGLVESGGSAVYANRALDIESVTGEPITIGDASGNYDSCKIVISQTDITIDGASISTINCPTVTFSGDINCASVSGMFGQYAYSSTAKSYDTGSAVPKYGSPNISTNNQSGTVDPSLVYFNLIHISKVVTINKILSFCGTGGGGTGNVKYGIYSVTSTGDPDQKLYGSGSISFTGAIGTQISVSGVATTLSAGWYFLAAIYSDTAGAKVYSLSAQSFNALGINGPFASVISRAMYYDDFGTAYGFDLQTTYPTADMYVERGTVTTRMPALYFEVA